MLFSEFYFHNNIINEYTSYYNYLVLRIAKNNFNNNISKKATFWALS